MQDKNLPAEQTKKRNTKVVDLYDENQLGTAIKSDKMVQLLNANPKPEWIKEHPFVKGRKYLPIAHVEYLLKRIFRTQYRIEVVDTKMMLNAVTVTVRVHYFDIVSNDWQFHDGVGAAEIQTEKNTGSLKLDMSNINAGAVTIALPIAKSLAIKDACDHLGRIFGSDLNRKDILPMQPDNVLDWAQKWSELANRFEAVERVIPSKDYSGIKRIIDNQEKTSFDKALTAVEEAEKRLNSKIITHE